MIYEIYKNLNDTVNKMYFIIYKIQIRGETLDRLEQNAQNLLDSSKDFFPPSRCRKYCPCVFWWFQKKEEEEDIIEGFKEL